jgi:methylamine dehydrogenase accessory protein MauD
MDALTVSVVLLWLAVLALGLMLWALSRQVGVLFERVAPMGALVTDAGPAVGEPSPSFSLRGIQSEAVHDRRARRQGRRWCSSCHRAARCARS